MLTNKLLGFTEQASMIKSIKEDVFPKLVDIITTIDATEIEKFNKYVLNYAKSSDINERSRSQFYLLHEHIENQSLLRNSQNTPDDNLMNEEIVAGQQKQQEESVPQNESAVVQENKQKNSSVGSHASNNNVNRPKNKAAENGLLHLQDVAEAIEESTPQVEQTFINESHLRILRDPMPENEDEDEEDVEDLDDLEDDDGEMINLDDLNDEQIEMLLMNQGEIMEIDEEEDEVPNDSLEGLSHEELKERLPPYYFMNNKKKRNYFRKLNENYVNKIQHRKIQKPAPKVNFKLDKNQVKTFGKNQKIL
jgi:hypothetical protein